MSVEKFDHTCGGCEPVLVNPETGQVYAEDSPQMRAMREVWKTLPYPYKEAFHRVTCRNSRAPEDVAVMEYIATTVCAYMGIRSTES